MPPKASPPTPCTAWRQGKSPASSCTRCSPADGSPTTSTCRSSATATRRPHPTRDRRTPHPDRDPATDPRSRRQPRLSQHRAARAQRPGCPAVRRRPALHRRAHVAAEQLVGPQIVEMLNGLADKVVPELTSEPSWPTLRAHLLALAAETGEHPLLHLTQPPPDENSTPPQTWPPCWTGASPNPQPLTQDRYLGFPAYQKSSMIIPFGANIWPSDPN